MKLCILHRPGATSGGDYIALQNYAAALRRTGVDVLEHPADDLAVDFTIFDYVHLWAACSPDWGLPAARAVKEQGAWLIITPFWWSRDERQAFYGRPGHDLVPGYTPAVADTLRLADVLFPVTMSEAVECWKLAPRAKVWVVPMGCPERHEIQPAGNYVMCIGRIEPHKNQFNLAKACGQLGVHLLLCGDAGNVEYMEAIRAINPDGITRHGSHSNESKSGWLSFARVHALPSFFENPGLVHGEANAYGVPAVMGGHGCEPEFYGPGGIYCDPTSVDDIATAIQEAWNRPRGYWAELPTWDDAARKALEWIKGDMLQRMYLEAAQLNQEHGYSLNEITKRFLPNIDITNLEREPISTAVDPVRYAD